MPSFSSFDGVRIAYEVTGRGDPVVLLHGFASDSRTNWVRPGVADAIADAGWSPVLVDARGHGRSEKPHDPAAYRDRAMRRDVEALLDHLGIDQVPVVGYSMGSFLAIQVALSDPRVRALILGGVGLGQASIASRERSDRIAEGLEVADRTAITDPTALAYRNFADSTGADRVALAALQRSRLGPPSIDLLSTIQVPTLVLNGEDDTLVGTLDSISEAIPGASLELVPGNHLSAVVTPQFREAVVRFLSRLRRQEPTH